MYQTPSRSRKVNEIPSAAHYNLHTHPSEHLEKELQATVMLSKQRRGVSSGTGSLGQQLLLFLHLILSWIKALEKVLHLWAWRLEMLHDPLMIWPFRGPWFIQELGWVCGPSSSFLLCRFPALGFFYVCCLICCCFALGFFVRLFFEDGGFVCFWFVVRVVWFGLVWILSGLFFFCFARKRHPPGKKAVCNWSLTHICIVL